MSRPSTPDLDFNTPALRRYRLRRALKDKFANWGIALGGLSIIGAVLLIFFYLLYEVAPMFVPASAEKVNQYPVPGNASQPTLMLSVEEQNEIGLRVVAGGDLTFFRVSDGSVITTQNLPMTGNITDFDLNTPQSREMVFANDQGEIILVKHNYRLTYGKNTERTITPKVDYPYGKEPRTIFDDGRAIDYVSVRNSDSALLVSALDKQGELTVVRFVKEEDFLSGEIVLEREMVNLPAITGKISQVEVDQAMNWMFVLADQRLLHVINLRNETLEQTVNLSSVGKVTELTTLLGENALLVGTDKGEVSQWFMVREEGERRLKRIRTFETEADTVKAISTEQRRKGFFVAGEGGRIAVFHSTAHRTLLDEDLVEGEIETLTISPRAKDLLVETNDGQIVHIKVDNPHPEISWSSMWDEVWYEGYDEPEYTWQSSSSSNDFEPKYSLVPLAFGTLKGAFYAMLLAAPLAIAGAVYTAYFMAPAMRRKVKPIIELMEALPTVILGFLAGLALAPFIENNLLGIFAMMVVVPLSMLAFGFLWVNLPAKIRHSMPDGWDVLPLIPVIILSVWFAIEVSPTFEAWFFGGSMTQWLTNDMGVDFSQRNALIVGLAMGFAVIPTIFSIAEDAIFSVPKSLSYGSLALGATPWQTMVKVVLPTASPGIFSALMIGMGRAVGETMIVLMATGNTPITDINIFEGMRTLAANIAVEIPESAVGSTHYRVLFLTGFVLFVFTFVFNTLAEVVRHRLRTKYGQL
ncbi:ABC transporter permease subunit [Bermanella sp. R86510]|uniref:ABC transporter permease subunit n=1 Tax=unclassified Bermanella TaxID=2627862 RepID=UPI0037C80B7D